MASWTTAELSRGTIGLQVIQAGAAARTRVRRPALYGYCQFGAADSGGAAAGALTGHGSAAVVTLQRPARSCQAGPWLFGLAA